MPNGPKGNLSAAGINSGYRSTASCRSGVFRPTNLNLERFLLDEGNMTRTHKYSVSTNHSCSGAAYQRDVESGTAAPASSSSAKTQGTTSKDDLEGVHAENDHACCDDCSFNCGWFCTILVGLASLAFILGIYLIPSEGLFPVGVGRKGMIPLVRKGNLVVYPGQLSPDAIRRGTTDSYIISTDPSHFANNENTLNSIASGYPYNVTSKGLPPKPYVFCFLQNPGPNNPCYFRRIWLGNTCTPETNYGYRDDRGSVNPCFLIKLVNTADWYPENWQPNQVRESYKKSEYDSSHIGITCNSQRYVDQYKVKFTKNPMNGFAQKFFPISNFNAKDYIAPAVMFQINGLKMGETFTINCRLRAMNAYELTDSGSITITFQHPDTVTSTEKTNVTVPSDSSTTLGLQPKNPV